MQTTTEKLEQIKNDGYELDFGDVFSNGFEIYKKIAGISGISFLILTIIFVSIFMGIVAAAMGFSDFASQMTNFNITNFSIVGVLIYLLATILVTAFMAPFSAGILKMAFNASKNEEFSLSTAFELYKSKYFKDLFIAAIIISFLGAGINVALEFTGIKAIGALFVYFINFLTFLSIPLIIFGDQSATQSIQNSVLLVLKKPFLIAGLLIVTVLLAMFGIIGFCIGIFFTLPLIYAVHFAIYDAIIGTDKTSELDEIGSFVE
jgi:uncharacterized membrane protein